MAYLVYTPKRADVDGWSCRLYLKEDGDVLCHIVLPPDHWIWRTYTAPEDPIMAAVSARFGAPPPEPFAPCDKHGREIDIDWELSSPVPISLWRLHGHTIGWFGSRDIGRAVEDFELMVDWLLANASRAQFDAILDCSAVDKAARKAAKKARLAAMSPEERTAYNRRKAERQKKAQ